MVVRFLLLVGAVINQEHADAASASFPILNIFSSTQPRYSGAISGEAPTPDPPLKPSRGPSPGADFTPRLRPDPVGHAMGAERHRPRWIGRDRMAQWCRYGIAISHAHDPGRRRAGAPRPPAGAASGSCRGGFTAVRVHAREGRSMGNYLSDRELAQLDVAETAF